MPRELRVFLLVLLWVLALFAAWLRLDHARMQYSDNSATPTEWLRPTGNYGHTHIDFGGQWIMGRMVARGYAHELYNRNRQREIAESGFPWHREPPIVRDHSFPTEFAPPGRDGDPLKHDADALMGWIMGKDSPEWPTAGTALALPFAADNPLAAAALTLTTYERMTPQLVVELSQPALGGPLYPPVHGFFYAPLCYDDDPVAAYARFQWFVVGLTIVAGIGVAVMTRGRIAAPIAVLGILLYPGYRAGLDLGQNPAITLTILIWGWALTCRGREIPGGMIWGLLAFKPVWAMAFFAVPLLMGRWRFCLAMVLTGAAIGAATLPFTGIPTWKNWLAVGNIGATEYDVNENWVKLSRDLHGIPRRILLDFSTHHTERHSPLAAKLGWLLCGTVAGFTGIGYLLFADRRRPLGLGAGFLFLGAYLCCYRFMYYDVLLSLLGVFVLWGEPYRLFWGLAGHLCALPLGPRWLGYVTLPPVLLVGLMFFIEVVIFRHVPQATFQANRLGQWTVELGYYHPWETVLTLMLWVWCGWRLMWGGDGEPPMVQVQPDAKMTDAE